jgi:hypothetical protein
MWKCEFIGMRGQTNDRIHHQLSKILKVKYLSVPYLASDPLIFHEKLIASQEHFGRSVNNKTAPFL